MNQKWTDTLKRLHASPHRIALVAAGGGCKQVGDCFASPGASKTFVDAAIPYSHAAMRTYLGGLVLESHASTAAARALAVRAHELAARHDDAENCTGVSIVAALPTTQPRRGQDRIHVIAHNRAQTRQWTLDLIKGSTTRAEAERFADQLLRHAITSIVDEATAMPDFTPCGKLATDSAPALVQAEPDSIAAALVFPGSFNPVHDGHQAMARIAGERYGADVVAELSVQNVDKPSLDHLTIRDRVAGANVIGQVRLTKTAKFSEKAALFPGARFIIGADTAVRLDDTKYYDNSQRNREFAFDTIAMHGCRFVVFGRQIGGHFCDATAMALSPKLSALCDFIPETEFRSDISSSELRRNQT